MVKGVKDWNGRLQRNGSAPLQLLDTLKPHILSHKEVQIYYRQTNGGEVLVDEGILAKNQCSSITLSGHRCNNMRVIGIEYCWLHLSIFFNLELRQSKQHDQQGHQLKALGLFACAGLFDLNTPCFRTNDEILPMKAQRKSLIGFI